MVPALSSFGGMTQEFHAQITITIYTHMFPNNIALVYGCQVSPMPQQDAYLVGPWRESLRIASAVKPRGTTKCPTRLVGRIRIQRSISSAIYSYKPKLPTIADQRPSTQLG
uniref:Uncharacterized protein n=1 Tax=Branchiostoma floridae TaxID=7739 RepID=C3ZJZ8_BRAFL|eukprot:XP_002591154.1 hypothetical protein BRAFLDRAFT_108915 [Branchiostoma floridae]